MNSYDGGYAKYWRCRLEFKTRPIEKYAMDLLKTIRFPSANQTHRNDVDMEGDAPYMQQPPFFSPPVVRVAKRKITDVMGCVEWSVNAKHLRVN